MIDGLTFFVKYVLMEIAHQAKKCNALMVSNSVCVCMCVLCVCCVWVSQSYDMKYIYRTLWG